MIYSQLRVSCGLSAIINSLQPEELKITPTQSFANWLDIQWLKISNNNDPDNPLTQLCIGREHKWVAVLDYILLRKIRSSFLICKGISPAVLVLEADYNELNWNTLSKVFIIILERLNSIEEDWPLWHYKGQLKNPQENINDEKFRKDAIKLIQSIKMFYEIYQSNITVGLEYDWKQAINSLGGKFPEEVTAQAIFNHLDYYKTDFELKGLLETFGYIPDYTYGMQYPKNVKPNSIVLINRPGHWVCEDCSNPSNRGTVLDSLTCSTDAIRMGDIFNYFRPTSDLKAFSRILSDLEKIFPNIEIQIERIEYVEFPPLELPITEDPLKTAEEFNEKALKSYMEQDYKQALNFKRIECELIGTSPKLNIEKVLKSLIEFTYWCLLHDKPQTLKENIEKLKILINKYFPQEEIQNYLKSNPNYIKLLSSYYKLIALYNNTNELYQDTITEIQNFLNIIERSDLKLDSEDLYDLINQLGVTFVKIKNYNNAIDSFKKAKEYAIKSLENNSEIIAEDELGYPFKYWPAIIRAVDNKIQELNELIKVKIEKIS